MKKLLLVDDSALMRRVLCDIINEDGKYIVEDQAKDGVEALELIISKKFDVVVLDVHMPRMNGIELLRELREREIAIRVIMVSSLTKEGARVTMEALELGAIDFVTKPGSFLLVQSDEFKPIFLKTLDTVALSRLPAVKKPLSEGMETADLGRHTIRKFADTTSKPRSIQPVKPKVKADPNDKFEHVVAIASSTGGPKALQEVIRFLPKEINAPVIIVQHMPIGFTQSFSERLDGISKMDIKEAEEGDVLQRGCVYLARGGQHLNVVFQNGMHFIHYSDEPVREGVKPCANYMYESLIKSKFKQIDCVVLTGMGRDGTVGIQELKEYKKITIIAQDEETCVVYGMPKSITKTGLVKKNYPITEIANEIIKNVGVR